MVRATPAPPSRETLRAFGCPVGGVRGLHGGQGESFLAGDLVLKRIDNATAARWCAGFLASLHLTSDFRVAKPVQSKDGDWVQHGWTASERVDGEHVLSGRWDEILLACRAFHQAAADCDRPRFLDERNDPWALGDRVAWEQVRVTLPQPVGHRVDELLLALSPLTLRSQVIHGDFGGNVLLTAGNAPAVIDFSPCWRPAPFAEAVVIADAIAWHEAPLSLVQWFTDPELRRQLILRASIYRLVTTGVAFPDDPSRLHTEVGAYDRVVRAVQPTLGNRSAASEPQVT